MSKNIIIYNDYAVLITNLKQKVTTARLKAHRAVDTELIKLYWTIGKVIKPRCYGFTNIKKIPKDIFKFRGICNMLEKQAGYQTKLHIKGQKIQYKTSSNSGLFAGSRLACSI